MGLGGLALLWRDLEGPAVGQEGFLLVQELEAGADREPDVGRARALVAATSKNASHATAPSPTGVSVPHAPGVAVGRASFTCTCRTRGARSRRASTGSPLP